MSSLSLPELVELMLFEDYLKLLQDNAEQLNGKWVYATHIYGLGKKLAIRCRDSSQRAKELIGLEIKDND